MLPVARPKKEVRIGGASAFWGDSELGVRQLVDVPGMHYITFDYLAELTMSIMATARAKNPELGYATDFVETAMRATLRKCVEAGIGVISNAGGLNPQACARALARLAQEQGLSVRIAVVDGSDAMPLMPSLQTRGITDFYDDRPMPARILTANAYLGAGAIARALSEGADVVITGRVVDSASVLGVLMYEFGWSEQDLDLLAAGSLAGHIIECGCQATGGLHTDWHRVPDWPNIGYPVIDCAADGSFVLTKPEGTGGVVLASAVAEQLVYEIGDPENYVLPDVVCDFSHVSITQPEPDVVRVSGARGKLPPATYKVCSTHVDGFTCTGALSIVGIDAIAKARRSGEAVVERVRGMLRSRGMADLREWKVDVLGAEEPYGPHARQHHLREALVRIVARHERKDALELFAREIAPAGTSWAPGTTGTLPAGRPAVTPLVRLFTFTLPKAEVQPWIEVDGGGRIPVPVQTPRGDRQPAPARARSGYEGPSALDSDVEVPLIRIAWARSGDKGDTSNIGVIARSAAVLPYLLREVTEETVARYLAHCVDGTVTRYLVPGINAINLVLTRALGGGGMASMRMDPLGKGMAQILLSLRVRVPAWVVEEADCATERPFVPGIATGRASNIKQQVGHE